MKKTRFAVAAHALDAMLEVETQLLLLLRKMPAESNSSLGKSLRWNPLSLER